MAKILKRKHKLVKKKKKGRGPKCPCFGTIRSLGDLFNKLAKTLDPETTFWFRGNANIEYDLRPSALRYMTPSKRDRALNLLDDFKRFGELKLPKPPNDDEKFKWVQLARHYGLPTRLLDWTRNASIALYFACEKDEDKDGAIFIINPIDLNRKAFPRDARIFDPNRDAALIQDYLDLGGKRTETNRLKTIAINPTWNSERIMLQQGVFTLHGSKYFTLTNTLENKQASSLVHYKVENENKENLLEELERVGINEMSIFPELEHMCHYLKWRENL